jgi:nucleotide-binding universal stress UspA family protein
MKTILTPIDFSGVTGAVVTEAAALARALDGRIVLLTVIQPPAITSEYAALMDDIAEVQAAGEKHAARQLAKYEAELVAADVSVETVQLTGAPIPLIAEQAKRFAADYIVMGSHGHAALYELLVGSTTHGVLLRAECPVVIVPAKQKKPASRRKELHAVG